MYLKKWNSIVRKVPDMGRRGSSLVCSNIAKDKVNGALLVYAALAWKSAKESSVVGEFLWLAYKDLMCEPRFEISLFPNDVTCKFEILPPGSLFSLRHLL
jgi:hypothetical protein